MKTIAIATQEDAKLLEAVLRRGNGFYVDDVNSRLREYADVIAEAEDDVIAKRITDPELAAWSDPAVQECIAYQYENSGIIAESGPTLFRYRVTFEFPDSVDVDAFTITEAIAKAMDEFMDSYGVHDPQVMAVTALGPVLPVCRDCAQLKAKTRTIAEVKDGRVTSSHDVTYGLDDIVDDNALPPKDWKDPSKR
jgi:hypothetical protein